jgi:hypothetical protein
VLQSQDADKCLLMILLTQSWSYLYIEAHSIHSLHQALQRTTSAQWCWRETFAQSIWTSILRRCTEASQLCMQHRDSILPDAQKLS